MTRIPMRCVLFLPLLVAGLQFSASCSRSVQETLTFSRVPYAPATLDSHRAFDEVGKLVALGARDAGTEGAHRAAVHLEERLEAFGAEARLDSFREPAPGGETLFHNVEGKLPGNRDAIILLGSHFDTKSGISEDFQGANDSGSSSGLLLELARVTAAHRAEHPGDYPELRFLFFDGEECRRKYGPRDGFHGSRHYAQALVESGEAEKVLAVIVLDMIGDKDLGVTLPRNSSPSLLELAFRAAEEEGARDKFSLFRTVIGDDHVAFLERGMPAIDLIDFHFGSRPGLNDYWHTPQDTMERISPDSLGLVGRVVLRMLNQLEAETAE